MTIGSDDVLIFDSDVSKEYLRLYRRDRSKEDDMDKEAMFSAINSKFEELKNVLAGDDLEMIRELPPGYRAVFNLYVIEGKRHKEIAELLGIQEQTSASQLARAKKLLAKRIKEYVTLKQEPR